MLHAVRQLLTLLVPPAIVRKAQRSLTNADTIQHVHACANRVRLHADGLHAWTHERQVICVDNFFTGSKENVAHLLGKTNFECIRHDVVEKLLLEVDQIFHLACPASPVHYKCAASNHLRYQHPHVDSADTQQPGSWCVEPSA